MKMDTTTIILIALGGYLFYEYIWPNLSSSSSTTTTPTTTPTTTTTTTPVTTPTSTTTVNTPVSNTPTSGTTPPVTTSVQAVGAGAAASLDQPTTSVLPAVGAGGAISVNNTMTPPTNLNCMPGYAPQSVYDNWQCSQVPSTSSVAGAGAAASLDQPTTSVQAVGAGAAAASDQPTTDIAALTALAASHNGGVVPNTLTFSEWNWLYLMLYPSGGRVSNLPSTTMMTLNQFLGLPGTSSISGIGLLNLTNSRMGTPMMTRLAGLGMRRNVGMWG